ncbi:hypothetical protein B0H14DRAFT_3867693 [Mycena olivaceomarginata]|nr:hypothetical protein B0H14DRAFT_3867693 [Mycena olivaceomarginata]
MGAILARISPPKFRPERDVPDLSGKIIIVTQRKHRYRIRDGQAVALEECESISCRAIAGKCCRCYQEARARDQKAVIFLQLDLADLPSVRKAAETFLFQDSRLDILFNNGGVMISPDLLTAQNHDLQFGTNVIGHFFLTELLLPALTQSYQETQVPARILHTSSAGHVFAPGNGIDFVSLKGGPERDAMLYGESKLGNILISNYFAKAYSDVLVSCSLHPGPINTELTRHAANWLQAIANPFFYPAPANTNNIPFQLWGATVATPAQITGQYLIPWGKLAKADKRASNTKLEEEVVAYIKDQIKDF